LPSPSIIYKFEIYNKANNIWHQLFVILSGKNTIQAMRKLIFYTALIVGLLSCSNSQYDLDRMGTAVRQHIRASDPDNGTITKIERLEAVSYEKIPEDKRGNPDETYLCKVLIQGTWSYYNSNRIFNVNDTVNTYFNSKKVFLRMDNIYEN